MVTIEMSITYNGLYALSVVNEKKNTFILYLIGGLCSGQLLRMWAALCSGSPQSHVALSALPHFFMGALYRPIQSAVCLESSSVFDSDLLPRRLLLGLIRGDVLGWVRMLPTPASSLPQYMHPSTGHQG